MKNEIIKTRILQVIAVIVAVLGIVINLQPLLSSESNRWIRLTTVCAVSAQIYIAIYALCGFRKKSATFLKVFTNMVLLAQFFRIIDKFTMDTKEIIIPARIAQLIIFAALVALAVNEDFDNIKFGRTKSLVFCGIILAESVVTLCIVLIKSPGIYRGGDMFGTLLAIGNLDKLTLAISLLIAMYAKYEDRKKRAMQSQINA